MKKNKVINFAKNTLKNDRIVVVIPIFVYGINEICKTINNMMNQSKFATAFRDVMKITPAEYRKQDEAHLGEDFSIEGISI